MAGIEVLTLLPVVWGAIAEWNKVSAEKHVLIGLFASLVPTILTLPITLMQGTATVEFFGLTLSTDLVLLVPVLSFIASLVWYFISVILTKVVAYLAKA